MKKTVVAAVSVAAFLLTSSIASAQVCPIGIMISAAIVGSKEHRELTSDEALTCGLATLFAKPKDEAKQPEPRKKVARAKKQQ